MEFEEMKEEGETMTLEKILEAMKALPLEDRLALVRNIAQSITPDQKAAFRAVQYEFAEAVKEEAKQMTDQEFEEKLAEKLKEKEVELKAGFEAKEKAKSELMEFEAIVDKKILPAHKQAYILAFKANQGNSEILEFEEGKMTEKENLKKKVEGMGDITLTEEFAKADKKDINKTDAQKRLEEIKKVSEDTSKMMGGKR